MIFLGLAQFSNCWLKTFHMLITIRSVYKKEEEKTTAPQITFGKSSDYLQMFYFPLNVYCLPKQIYLIWNLFKPLPSSDIIKVQLEYIPVEICFPFPPLLFSGVPRML